MDNDFLEKVGIELKLVRIEHNMSLVELSNKSGISTATLSNYENSKTLMFLDKILEILENYDDITPTIFFNRITTKM